MLSIMFIKTTIKLYYYCNSMICTQIHWNVSRKPWCHKHSKCCSWNALTKTAVCPEYSWILCTRSGHQYWWIFFNRSLETPQNPAVFLLPNWKYNRWYNEHWLHIAVLHMHWSPIHLFGYKVFNVLLPPIGNQMKYFLMVISPTKDQHFQPIICLWHLLHVFLHSAITLDSNKAIHKHTDN